MSNRLFKENESVFSFAAIFGVVTAFFLFSGVAFLYGVWANGFVIMKLWSWFVVPVFGLPALTIVQAFGLFLLCGLVTHHYNINTNKDERTIREKIGSIIGSLFVPWLTFIFGWIIHSYLM